MNSTQLRQERGAQFSVRPEPAYQAVRRALLSSGLLAFAGCSSLPEVSAPGANRAGSWPESLDQPSKFSRALPGPGLPGGWEPYLISPSKKPTSYDLVDHENRTVLRARTVGKAATGLYFRLENQPGRQPDTIEWRWLARNLDLEADVSDTWADDSPGRIILAFDGDHNEFGFRDRLFFEQARAFTGLELPYATLIYVWDPKLPVGTVVPIPQTTRIRYLVVQSGEQSLNQWLDYRRQIQDDYRQVFQKSPGRLMAVGLMTDSDDLGKPTETLYDDLNIQWKAA